MRIGLREGKGKNEQSLVKGFVLIEVMYAKANQQENGWIFFHYDNPSGWDPVITVVIGM